MVSTNQFELSRQVEVNKMKHSADAKDMKITYVVALQKTTFLTRRTGLLGSKSASGGNSANCIACGAGKFSCTATVWTLLSFLDLLASNLKRDYCSHDSHGAARNSSGDFVDGGPYYHTFQPIKKGVAGTYSRWVDSHSRT